MQHKMAVYIASRLFEGAELQEEKLLVIYGIETFLNEFLKAISYIIIGIVLGIGFEVLFSILFFLCIRRIAGGRHCKTNVACYTVSVLTIFGSIIMAYWVYEYFQQNINLIFLIATVESIAIILFIPFEIDIISNKSIVIRKVLMFCFLIGGEFTAVAMNLDMYGVIILILIAIEILSCIRFKCKIELINKHLS